nr:RNA dependent RNA polymerase [Turkana Partiti-like virus 1]
MENTIQEEFIEMRDFLEERSHQLNERWRLINQHNLKDANGVIDYDELERLHIEENVNRPIQLITSAEGYEHDINELIENYKASNIARDEDFEFFRPIKESDKIPERVNVEQGLNFVPLKYHKTRPKTASQQITEEGFKPDKPLLDLINNYYPEYRRIIEEYRRPLGTTDSTFNDFNKPQKPSEPFTQERKDRILYHLKKKLNVKPYKPVYYESIAFCKMPLNTGTGYFDRYHYRTRARARLTRSGIYKDKPNSKGYFYTATYKQHQIIVHNIKHYRSPVIIKTNSDKIKRNKIVQDFILKRVTMLFTRNHISRLFRLKTRPVYNVDPIFLKLEASLTFPAMIQARPISSCIMYSLETIRGGCHYLDHTAKNYSSYFTIDWSSYDQTLPRVITDFYYQDFLESLIVINKGYTSTINYRQHIPQPADVLFKKAHNMLNFLHEWYNSMVYVTSDGYGYQRTCAGVPSGLFNTQYLDSVGNITLLIDALIEFGLTDTEIDDIKLFIMGDDNTGFTHMNIFELDKFVNFFGRYSKRRWNMDISLDKCKVTEDRSLIEVLGYSCNFGYAKRSIDKLVAQLCYPERGINIKYMSYRAIGIAYAAGGHSSTFHQFCERVYFIYYKDRVDITSDVRKKVVYHLPGIFRAVDNYAEFINFEKFPTIEEVRKEYSEWKGSLSYEPRWDSSYFTDPPYYDGDDYITIKDYKKIHNIEDLPVEFHDFTSLSN